MAKNGKIRHRIRHITINVCYTRQHVEREMVFYRYWRLTRHIVHDAPLQNFVPRTHFRYTLHVTHVAINTA